MYLGKPQTEHPMYAVSPLSTNKKVIYTIKPEYTDQQVVKNELKEAIELTANRNLDENKAV